MLRGFYPDSFGAYREPFLGSGAVFFDLVARGRLDGRDAALSDSNHDLIACYRTVSEAPDAVVDELRRLADSHARTGPGHYYDVRNNRFNPQRAALAASRAPFHYTPALAAMFIYLNRTGYNGLFRLNAGGEFNVPEGRYLNPRICDEPNLRRAARALGRSGVTLAHAPFDRVLDGARRGDFVYFDPPYAPLSRTARFTGYTAAGFDLDDQKKLRGVVIALATLGCHVVMSNSTAPEIAALYEDDAAVRTAGLRCFRVPARRAINSNARRRGTIEEYVITNVRP